MKETIEIIKRKEKGFKEAVSFFSSVKLPSYDSYIEKIDRKPETAVDIRRYDDNGTVTGRTVLLSGGKLENLLKGRVIPRPTEGLSEKDIIEYAENANTPIYYGRIEAEYRTDGSFKKKTASKLDFSSYSCSYEYTEIRRTEDYDRNGEIQRAENEVYANEDSIPGRNNSIVDKMESETYERNSAGILHISESAKYQYYDRGGRYGSKEFVEKEARLYDENGVPEKRIKALYNPDGREIFHDGNPLVTTEENYYHYHKHHLDKDEQFKAVGEDSKSIFGIYNPLTEVQVAAALDNHKNLLPVPTEKGGKYSYSLEPSPIADREALIEILKKDPICVIYMDRQLEMYRKDKELLSAAETARKEAVKCVEKDLIFLEEIEYGGSLCYMAKREILPEELYLLNEKNAGYGEEWTAIISRTEDGKYNINEMAGSISPDTWNKNPDLRGEGLSRAELIDTLKEDIEDPVMDNILALINAENVLAKWEKEESHNIEDLGISL